MRIIIESTDKIVELSQQGGAGSVPARLWEGHTDEGIPVICYVTRIATPEPVSATTAARFAHCLTETRPPSPVVAAIPARLIL